MSDTPFDENDVLWRWVPTEQEKALWGPCLIADEAVLTKALQPRYSLLWRRYGHHWEQVVAGSAMAELFRQLRESQSREARFRAAFHEAVARPQGIVPAEYTDLYEPAFYEGKPYA